MTTARGVWIRPCNSSEQFMEMMHQQQTMLSSYWLTLGSVEPIQVNQIDQALRHLYRTIPSLRSCFKMRDKQAWVCEMTQEVIDMKVMPDVSHEELFEKLSYYKYDVSNGPLWCSRIKQEKFDIEGVVPDEGFKHQTHVYFGFHHSITDGYSNIRICNIFIDFLNKVINGDEINDLIQLAEYDDGKISMYIEKNLKHKFDSYPDEWEEELDAFKQKWMHVPELTKLPQCLDKSNPRTMNFQKVLNKEITKAFTDKCKSEKVSLNSAFTVIANIALAKVLAELGSEERSYTFFINHVINKRRYWNCDTNRLFGPHIGQLPLLNEVDVHPTDFWDTAREIHAQIHETIKDEKTYEYGLILNYILSTMDQEELIKKFNTPTFDYGITNMGNLSGLIDESGTRVRLTRLVRTTSTQGLANICSHVLQTFRGQIFYGIDYVTSFMTTDTASSLSSHILEEIKMSICL